MTSGIANLKTKKANNIRGWEHGQTVTMEMILTTMISETKFFQIIIGFYHVLLIIEKPSCYKIYLN